MPISAARYSMDTAYEGQIASLQNYTHIKGIQDGIVNSQASVLPFGRFVIEKPSGEAGEIQLPSATGQTLIGVVPFQDRFEKDIDGNSGIPAGQTAGVMVKGIVWVRAEDAMSRGADVYVRHTANVTPGTFEAIGRIRSDADTANADAVTNVKLLDNVVAGGLARLELDLPTTL